MTRSLWLSLWLGAALSSMFFYPLVAGLADNAFSLQWRPAHGLELGASACSLAIMLGALLHLAERLRPGRIQLCATLVLISLPAASFGMHLLRQLGASPWLNDLGRTTAGMLLAGAAALTLLGMAIAAFTRPVLATGAIRVLLLILSPLTLLSIFQVTNHSLETVPILITDTPSETGGQADERQPVGGFLPDIFVLVFDELDYDFVYDSEGHVLRELPNLARFAALSDNYHQATSPGRRTLFSMPGLVTGVRGMMADSRAGEYGVLHEERLYPRDVAHENIFMLARQKGYRTALQGWGLPWCQMLEPALDSCRSFSSYNYSTAELGFSPLDPIMTTFILWPFQRPFGLMKSFAGSRHQRHLVTQTYARAIAALDGSRPLFQLTHFSIPHDPFIYDGDRYAPAANPYLRNRDGYQRQLRYVDHVFGQYISELEARGLYQPSTILVLSDHAYRAVKDPSRFQEIPLLVKRSYQTTKQNFLEPTRSEDLLWQIVSSAAPVSQSPAPR